MTDEAIGERIRRLRRERGLSMRRLSELAGVEGVGFAYISRLESGQRGDPSVPALRKLAGALGVTADYLETGEDAVVLRRTAESIDAEARQWGLSVRLADLTPGERAMLERELGAGLRNLAGPVMAAIVDLRGQVPLPLDPEEVSA